MPLGYKAFCDQNIERLADRTLRDAKMTRPSPLDDFCACRDFPRQNSFAKLARQILLHQTLQLRILLKRHVLKPWRILLSNAGTVELATLCEPLYLQGCQSNHSGVSVGRLCGQIYLKLALSLTEGQRFASRKQARRKYLNFDSRQFQRTRWPVE